MKQKLKGGTEYDVIGGGRHMYCYTKRAGVCAKIKRKARRRLRQEGHTLVRDEENDSFGCEHLGDDESYDPFYEEREG